MWNQRDAPDIVRSILRRAVPDRECVRATLPDGWTPAAAPHIVVTSDGTPIGGPGWTGETVRVTVHARDITTARSIMTQIDGLLCDPLKAGWMYQIRPSTGLIAIKDSKVGGGLSSATYTVVTNRNRS